MPDINRTDIAIDLKSFYASVECIERGLNPLTTNLVVADAGRTEKTICLAVSPSLKSYGIPGRPRLFEVVQKVQIANRIRQQKAPRRRFTDKTSDDTVLQSSPEYAIDYIVATPRMAHYMEYSTRIYNVYLNYVAPEDIHVYSIDEIFMDVTAYLRTYNVTARELACTIILDVLNTTGITATAGMETNLYLAKNAMDIRLDRSGNFGTGKEDIIEEVKRLPPTNGRGSGDADDHFARFLDVADGIFLRARKSHNLVRGQKRTLIGLHGFGDLSMEHSRPFPRHGILALDYGSFAKHLRDVFRRFQSVRRKHDLDVAIGNN